MTVELCQCIPGGANRGAGGAQSLPMSRGKAHGWVGVRRHELFHLDLHPGDTTWLAGWDIRFDHGASLDLENGPGDELDCVAGVREDRGEGRVGIWLTVELGDDCARPFEQETELGRVRLGLVDPALEKAGSVLVDPVEFALNRVELASHEVYSFQ